MSKKHIFLRVFSKITIFACVFCTISAWADTTTCDIDFTPVTGNSWQNGTPTPENPVDIISVGDKTVNLFDITALAGSSPVSYSGNTITINGTNVFTGKTLKQLCPEMEVGKTYYLSMSNSSTTPKKYIWLQNGAVGGQWHTGNSRTITQKDLDGGVKMYCATAGQTIVEMQIEESSTPTSYVPYGYQIPVVGTGANGSQTTTSVYLGEPLRKVGDYADVLDYKNGQIIRNVGVKVLTGTESWTLQQEGGSSYFYVSISDMKSMRYGPGFCSHFTVRAGAGDSTRDIQLGSNNKITYWFEKTSKPTGVTDVASWKSFLATQYANGTPVTVYYPLATPVVEQIENWSCPVPITDIKIATTKMVDEEFAAAEAQLAATVQTIESVVSRTIAQTGQIATLQETKQTRPDENCPANMKCLLVQDEDGTPHWYPIIEP